MNDKGHLFILCEKNKKGERVPEKSLVLIGGLKAIFGWSRFCLPNLEKNVRHS